MKEQGNEGTVRVTRMALLALIAVLVLAISAVEFFSPEKEAAAVSGSQSGGYVLVEKPTNQENYLVVFDPESNKILLFVDQNNVLRLRGLRPTGDADQKLLDSSLPMPRVVRNLERGNGETAKNITDAVEIIEKNPTKYPPDYYLK